MFLQIAPNGVARTTFCITATKLEPIKLNVKALTNVPGLSDAIEQVINVKVNSCLYVLYQKLLVLVVQSSEL